MSDRTPFVLTSYVISTVGLGAATLLMRLDLRIAFLPIAFLCGWPQVASL